MKDNSVYKLGGIASIFLGISYLASGITSALTPAAVAGVPDVQLPIMYFEQNKILILSNWWAQLIGAVFALAMIPAVSATVRDLNEGWVRWTGTLATLAFAVVILDNYWAIVYTDTLAKFYTTGTATVREAMTIPGSAQWIDVKGWLAYGAVGVWILIVSILALRNNRWPRPLAYLGILGALVYFLTLMSWVVPVLFVSGALLIIGLIGGILAPLLFTWMGIFLRRVGSEQPNNAISSYPAENRDKEAE